MKKQITEIEREITEKSNRPITMTAVNDNNSCASALSPSETTSTVVVTAPASSVSPSTFKPGSVVPSVNLSSQINSTCPNPIIIESRPTDIDLELLDPLGRYLRSYSRIEETRSLAVQYCVLCSSFCYGWAHVLAASSASAGSASRNPSISTATSHFESKCRNCRRYY